MIDDDNLGGNSVTYSSPSRDEENNCNDVVVAVVDTGLWKKVKSFDSDGDAATTTPTLRKGNTTTKATTRGKRKNRSTIIAVVDTLDCDSQCCSS